ncbi:MAG: hypothetical protein IJ272_06625 [Clostridia bacterium]|nr:hypothetical protein [Clostridia bacterium]
MDKFNELRSKYPKFEYNSYDIVETENSFEVSYDFVIPGLVEFKPTWSFPKPQDRTLDGVSRRVFETAIFNLGIVEVVSYLKATCSPKLVVKCGALNAEQIAWYKKLYINGLGEFFYRNNIVEAMNIDTFLDIKVENENSQMLSLVEELKGNLVPVGGGKDSSLSLEVLKHMDNICYIVNPRGASRDSAIVGGYNEDKIYAPKRTIDTRLLELNKQGFLNGHTPFSAILAFSSYASAILLGRKNIILSNEASANEANVSGTNINHQYSKSIEFENDFREYVSKFICENGPNYFSLLRPLSEWQIVRAFVKTDKYFEIFKSCNVGSKQDIWCENCPKCLYVYIMVKAFLSDEDMARIFKTDMLDNEALRDIFNGLVYPDYDKPFECVGTKDEINLSLNMIVAKYNKEKKPLPALLKDFNPNLYNLELVMAKQAFKWNEDNNLPEEFEKTLRQYIK